MRPIPDSPASKASVRPFVSPTLHGEPPFLDESFCLDAPFSVAARFFDVAERLPERPALILPGREPISYASLADRVHQLRARIRNGGVRPNDVVAVAFDDPWDWAPALLSILAEGALYVVLDSRLPVARLRSILEDSTARRILGTPGELERITDLGALGVQEIPDAPEPGLVERLPAVERTETSLAFLAYTSGSTGSPKGIALRHANILHEVAVHTATLQLTPEDRLTGLYPPSTVGCTRDFYAALLNGASVAFFPFRELGFAALRDWIRDQRITRYHSVPPIFRELMQELGTAETLPDLRTVFLAGDRVTWNDVDLQRSHTSPACRFYTGIGTTETSSLYAHGFIDPEEPRSGPIPPSGTAVPGARVQLVDPSGRLSEPGVPGEIVVEGRWLAAGFWRRTAAAAEPFPVADGPEGRRRFRTGDFATLDGRGRILFQGRQDQQVKILGNRIDLSETDLHLRRLPGVREVAVRMWTNPAHGNGSVPVLAAFVAWNGQAPTPAEIRSRLSTQLPAPAVPSRFYWLDEFPRLANGKLNLKELDDLAASRPPEAEITPGMPNARPSTPAEQRMAALWREVLGVPSCESHDSFFALGGHSLLAVKLLGRVRREFNTPVTLRQLFDAPTLADFLSVIGNPHPQPTGSGVAAPASTFPEDIPVVPRDPPPPASPAQERLWFLDVLEPRSTSYVMPDAVRFLGPLDVDALGQALREIVARHESLRTVFSSDTGALLQIVRPVPPWVLEMEDLSEENPPDREARVTAARHQTLAHPFSLTEGPLFRFRLLRLGESEHLFLRAFHHIIADGWSVGLFHRELKLAYQAARTGTRGCLAELRRQFADVAAAQRSRLDRSRMGTLLRFWERQLADIPARLELPHDPEASSGPPSAQHLLHPLSTDLAVAIEHLSQSLNSTPFMVLLAAFQALLGRLAGTEDVVVGTPVAGRQHPDSEPLIGFFINTVALRTRLTGNPTFRNLVIQVRDTVLEAQEHQELPFEKLIEHLRPDRSQRHHPVFQVLFNLIPFEEDVASLPGLTSVPEPVPSTDPKFDLTLYILSRRGSLTLKARYASNLFTAATIKRMLAQFEALLVSFSRDPNLPVGAPSLVLSGDHAVLPCPETPLRLEAGRAIHAAFEDRAREAPERTALRDPRGEWTYGDLDRAADRIAAALQSSGIRPGATVAVAATPSAPLVAALIGIFKIGGRFLILDAAQTVGRLRRMAAISRPAFLLVADSGDDVADWCERLRIDRLTCPALRLTEILARTAPLPVSKGPGPSGSDPAYVVFTSGSTGEPLGICGDHGPVTHFLDWQRARFGFSPADRFSLMSGLGHDPLLRDVFAPLSIGASLHIPAPDLRYAPDALRRWFVAEAISVTHLTPPLAQVLAGEPASAGPSLTALRWAFLGGDRLTAECARSLRHRAPRVGIVNGYGTTETPQVMAYHPVLNPGDGSADITALRDPIPIGLPIPDAQILVWTPGGQQAGVGEPGEILIRSPHLARGYLSDPDRTSRKFLVNPATGTASDRVYRTGDLGRVLPDGRVVLLRRIDGQFKIRGYRIEPEEIRCAIRTHAEVADSAVVLAPDGSQIHAYLVLRDPSRIPRRETLRDFLRGLLPETAIPSRWFHVPNLPLTPNGKTDFRALLHRTFPDLPGEDRIDEPRNAEEARVQFVWRQVLGRDVAMNENFFDLGGHSLLALKLVQRLGKLFRRTIPLADLLAHPTVAGLASHLTSLGHGNPARRAPTLKSRGFRGRDFGTPWIHVPGVAGFDFLSQSLATVVGRQRPFHDGLQYPGLDLNAPPERTIPGIAGALVAQVEALCPEGPLWLSGYSMGGFVAWELARQLTARGRPVERLVLFDARFLRDARRNSVPERLRLVAGQLRRRTWPERIQWALQFPIRKARVRGRHWALRRGWKTATLPDRMEAAGWEALSTYRPGPYSGPVTLLRATRLGDLDTGRLERDAYNGWGPWVHTHFEVIPVDCDHRSVFLEPVAPDVLQALDLLLRRTGEASVFPEQS